MVDKIADFRRERKRRRLENPPESDNDSESSGDDAGSSDGAYDELYDTDNGDDDDDNGGNWEEGEANITEPLEEEELKAMNRKRKLYEVYTAENDKWKKTKENLRVPTTADEVKRLRETEKLFHSNLYRLQIDEMLKEVKIKKKYAERFDDWFPSFESSLLQIDEQEEHELSDLDWLQQHGISFPLHQNFEFKGRFVFQAPKSVTIIGSYADGCSIGPKINVDVAIIMPEEIFFKKDYRNERFHRKRSLFLCRIAAHLVSSDLISNDGETCPKFATSYGGDPLLPILEISPAGYLAKKVKVRIHAFAPSTIFKLGLLSPSKGTMDSSLTNKNGEKDVNPATPLHNASILAALVAPANETFKNSRIASHQNISDAIVLLKVWLRQRRLDQGYAGFSPYILSMLIAYLVQKRRISPQMSSYQIIRIVWNFLSETDWTTKDAPTLAENNEETKSSLSELLEKYEVVFQDVTGHYNLAYNVNVTVYKRIRSESHLALQYLDNPSIDSFRALFITAMPFCRQFDHVMRFQNAKSLEIMINRFATSDQKLDGIANKERLAVSLIMNVLERGLSTRAKQWGIQSGLKTSWPISDHPPNTISSSLLIGINLDSQHAFSILDKGPAANEPEATEFREFWGEKSELRRFQDGSITEAVVWLDGKASLAERRVVCRSIIEYLLKMRLGLPTEKVLTYFADQVESCLHITTVKHPDFSHGTGEEAALATISALGHLSKKLRDLKDLPLEITEIQGVSPVFRYAEAFPPLASALRKFANTSVKGKCVVMNWKQKLSRIPKFIPALEVIVSLGLSGKWPSTPEAVRRIRAAFNIKIGKSLQDTFQLTTQAHADFVDVIQDGFVFRLRVAYQNEIALLREMVLPDGAVKYQDTPESIALERKIIHHPSLSACLHGLHQQAPAFGPTASLAKRWISSQMTIGEHMPEIVIELLVAHLFLHPEPFSQPTQPQTAFMRFLHLIGKTNWQTQPIILNFKDDITREEITEIEKYFGSHRKELPHLFIATPTDHKKSVWTTSAPSLTILILLAQLAQAALAVLEGMYTDKKTNLKNWKQIFQPDFSVYDALIHLKPLELSRRHQALRLSQDKKENVRELQVYKHEKDEKIPVVEFDPAQLYLRDLRDNFGDLALFFYDMYGGSVIGVVWKPAALEPKTFSVNQINGRRFFDGQLQVNQDAILEDFYILGRGLVTHVDTPERPAEVVPEKEE